MKTTSTQSSDFQELLNHWVGTPENGYLGSDYGYKASVLRLTEEAQCAAAADAIVRKLRSDLPLFRALEIHARWRLGSSSIEFSIDGQHFLVALGR